MNFKLKVEKGNVNFIQKTGNDFVHSRMNEGTALRIIKDSKAVVSDIHEGYPIHAGNFFFEGKIVESKKEKKEEQLPQCEEVTENED